MLGGERPFRGFWAAPHFGVRSFKRQRQTSRERGTQSYRDSLSRLGYRKDKMKVRVGARLALCVLLLAACGGGGVAPSDEGLPSVTFDPIIGGTPVSAYPEAA